jgi:hypothetical protein
MKMISLFFFVTIYFCAKAQVECAEEYILEGIITKGNKFEPVPFALFTNTRSGISTRSDERGYYSMSFPLSFVKDTSIVQIDIQETGFSPGKFWIGYNPGDTILSSPGNKVIWNYDLKFIMILENGPGVQYEDVSSRRINPKAHGFEGIKQSFEEFKTSKKRMYEIEQLKKNNQLVLFKLRGEYKYALCSSKSTSWLRDSHFIVFVDGKKVKHRDLNKLIKRNEVDTYPQLSTRENQHSKTRKFFMKTNNYVPN